MLPFTHRHAARQTFVLAMFLLPGLGAALGGCATGGGLGSDGASDTQVERGIGIIGTVTGFGSIIVNGYEIDYSRGLAVSRNGSPAVADDLRIGQVAEVEATGPGRRIAARRIGIRQDVVGPVERVDRAGSALVVLGQRVNLAPAPGATGSAAPLAIENISTGDMVAVSGLRRADGLIVASRIDRAPPGASAFIRGQVTSADAGGFRIGALVLEAGASARPADIQPGREAAVQGTIVNGRFRPNLIQAAPAIPFGGRVDRVSVEGFLGRSAAGALAVNGVVLKRPAPDSRARPGDKVIMDGPLDAGGRLAPETAVQSGAGGPGASRSDRRTDTDFPLQTMPPREVPRSDRVPLPDRYRRY